MSDENKPIEHRADQILTKESAENVSKILKKAREINKQNIALAQKSGDIEATLRIASNEAKVEIWMRRRGVDI